MKDFEAALDVVLPYVYSVHVKDHVMVRGVGIFEILQKL